MTPDMTSDAQLVAAQAPATSPLAGAGERRAPYVNDPRRKSALWACILSALPGLGQVYVGYYHVAFRNIVVICFLLGLGNAESFMRGPVEPALVMFTIFFWLHNIVDAGRRAGLYNQALDGLRQMELPEDRRQPQPFGSMAWGIGLIVVGIVFLSNTLFGLSLEWVGRVWPLAPIAVGVWLVYADRVAKHLAPALDA